MTLVNGQKYEDTVLGMTGTLTATMYPLHGENQGHLEGTDLEGKLFQVWLPEDRLKRIEDKKDDEGE